MNSLIALLNCKLNNLFMKLISSILLCFVFCSINLQASPYNNFREGYIISLRGDTLKGFLSSQISRDASEKCIFKSNVDNELKTYLPGEIVGYRYLDGKYYVSKEISTDSINKKLVFLEFLIKGMTSVYYYVDDEEHYYIEKSPVGLIELTEKEKIYDGTHYIIPSKAKGKLTYLMMDCPGINSEIQKTKLTHKSLIKLTKDYHDKVCTSESCIIYEKGNTSAKVRFGLLMGFSENMYNFGGMMATNFGRNYQIGTALKISNIFMFNEHLNLKINFILEKDSKSYTFTLQDNYKYCNIIYNNVPYTLNKTDYGVNSMKYLPSLYADLNVIDFKIPISLNCDFDISKKTTFTCGAGISNKLILTQNKNFEVSEYYANYGKSINSLLSGCILNAGLEGNWIGKHRVFVNVNYEYLSDFRSKVDRTLKLSNNQFSVQTGIYF